MTEKKINIGERKYIQETISSVKNPRIRMVCDLLAHSRERRRLELFVVEGRREITMAIESGYTVETLFYCNKITGIQNFTHKIPITATIVPITCEVFEKIAYRGNSDGLLAVFHAKHNTLNDIRLSTNPFIIVAVAIEKPGNMGAILRTANAAAADAFIMCDSLTDIYNPNVIRASLGCVFTQQTAVSDSQTTLTWLRDNGIKVYAAELQASQWYHATDFSTPCAVVVGAEADGLTKFWLQNADKCIKIPMRGKIDSLNVSVSTAIITFEAMRQRNFVG